ncbi:MAG TPA: DUF362 domain-containing protein [Gemmatimonadales bacterium]
MYASTPPYHPSEAFPEWPDAPQGSEDNPAYRAVRHLFRALGYDAEKYGTPDWNPLGALITPGDTVVLKPNLVSHLNLGYRSYGETDTDSLVTHGSVIRAVMDYAARALQGSGRLIIGDCPIQDTDWDALLALVGLPEIAAYAEGRFPGVSVEVRDYRLGTAVIRNGVLVERVVRDAAEDEYREVDLGRDSLLIPLMDGKAEFGVSRYPRHRMRRAHTPERNLYLLPRDFLEADVLINLPKLKSHMKAGITCALKNLVGLNGHKDYLPHFRYGSPKNGGDEYPDGNWAWDLMWRCRHADWDRDSGRLKLAFFYMGAALTQLLPVIAGKPRRAVTLGGGAWHGNETLWRTVLDINRLFLHYDRASGTVGGGTGGRRRYLAILDGLVGGHRESPLAPSPVRSGVMAAAHNPLAMDGVATALMRFDVRRIKQITEGFGLATLPLASFGLEDVRVLTGDGDASIADLYRDGVGTSFEPSLGFRGHIEYEET